MKKLLLIAALASLSAPAFASKARLNSLGNAEHLVDVQTAFNNPSHLLMLSDYATFETGPTNPTAYSTSLTAVPSNTAAAEGGFTRSHGDAKYGAYLGRKSDFTTSVRAHMGFKGQENPIELQYAMKGAVNWGVALNISSSDTKSGTTPQKQNAYGARFGAHTADWEAYGVVGLGADATGGTASTTFSIPADADAKLAGTTGFKIGGSYKMEHLYYFAKYYQDGAKYSSSVNTTADGLKFAQSQADVGVVDHMKMDGGEWFYGVSIQMFESNRNGASNAALESKVNTTSLPFLLGMEYDATSWMALRASVTQNVLLGSKKTQTSTTDKTDTIANNTTVAAGIALKMNKWTLDGSWAAGTTGDVNTTALITNAALTYNF